MLVLTRKKEEKICIGPNITVTVLRVKGHAVKIGIEAPTGVEILRAELVGPPGGPEPPAGTSDPSTGPATSGPKPAPEPAGPGGQPDPDTESTSAESGQLPPEPLHQRWASATQQRIAMDDVPLQVAKRSLAACS